MRRKRVFVLGGGCAGTAAALALSETPSLRRRFEVTVVERSWRLGGKGATGRDPARGWRIEEHGLHVWMGFYERTFAAIRGVLDELGSTGSPRLRGFDDAFTPRYAFSVWSGQGRSPWTLRLPPRPGLPGDGGPLPRFGAADLARFVAAVGRSLPRSRRGARLLADLVTLGAVAVRGSLASALRGESLDDHDLRGWLRHHGASAATTHASVIRAFYDMTFAYPDGHSGPDRGAVAAGAALRSMLRILFTYRGAPFWLLRHGMGDTAFAPAYEVLRRRGVQFAWMHAVERLFPGPAGVEALSLRATPLSDHPMLLEHDGLQVWPNAPQVRPGPMSSVMLRRGEDFDALILAVPIPALHGPLADLGTAHPHVQRALERSASVATRAAQVWTRRPVGLEGITTGFGRGFPTLADLSEVLGSESWSGRDAPRGLTYLVDTTPDRDEQGAQEATSRWLRIMGHAETETDRYVRVNDHPADRYVLTLPGTVADRVAPEDDRIDNLRFAGDWTATSINGGSVEAAFESGARAAASL